MKKFPRVIPTPDTIKSNVQGYVQGIGGCDTRIFAAEQEKRTSEANLQNLLADAGYAAYEPSDDGEFLFLK
jgi:hypothetical protein